MLSDRRWDTTDYMKAGEAGSRQEAWNLYKYEIRATTLTLSLPTQTCFKIVFTLCESFLQIASGIYHHWPHCAEAYSWYPLSRWSQLDLVETLVVPWTIAGKSYSAIDMVPAEGLRLTRLLLTPMVFQTPWKKDTEDWRFAVLLNHLPSYKLASFRSYWIAKYISSRYKDWLWM